MSKRKYTPKSSATEAQHARILEALRAGPKSTHDLRRLGVFQTSVRILELRRKGYSIQTERVTLIDSDGYAHDRAGLYSLIAEPAVEVRNAASL